VAPSDTLGAMVLHLHKDGGASAKPRIDLEREADVDRCGALADYWYVACLSTELGSDKPLARTMFGVPMALFRDERGRACAVRDRCLHRGTALSEGVVVDGKIACPYHGWMYEGTGGKCVHIPSLGDAQRGAVLSDVEHARSGLRLAPDAVGCLRTFAVREQDGLVYVHPGNAAPRKDPFPVPFWNHPGWVVYYMVTPFQNGVTNLVENFMDVPHTVYVHKGWFRNAKKKRVPATVERVNGSVLVTYKQEQDQISGLGFIMNPTALVGAGEPISATESLVYTAISYRLPFGGALVGKSLERLIHWYTRQVITQDTEIMKAQRKGILGGNEPLTFASTEADLLHADIELYRAWLLEGGKGDGPDDTARDIVFWI
jgi:phenylpropionate dioxygenase-like ring-hydroxylating dioxygenase large terminal subunit